MPQKPLCFVVMPFGKKRDPGGGPDIDFDAIYSLAIHPAIEDAEMQPIRADEERLGGIIHKPMFERLLLCDYAVVDLTTANANVFYELGVRHAMRPATTLCMFARHQQIPFDVSLARALPYALGKNNRFAEAQAEALRPAIAERLGHQRGRAAEGPEVDSPLFQLLQGYDPPDISRLKTDVFRDQVKYSDQKKKELTLARDAGNAAELKKLQKGLGPLDAVEAGVLIDLLLSYRAVKDWQGMIELYAAFPGELKRSVLVREQLGFALNRAGQRQEALRVLQDIVDEQGPSSETCGLMGRVYKDEWIEARKAGKDFLAEGHLDNAIESYRRGFEADWRDAYPGINAITLLDIKGDEETLARKKELLSVVRFAVIQRLASQKPDYWDFATLLEIAVLDQDEKGVREYLGKALAAAREPFEPETTANNLSLIREARHARGVEELWLDQTIEALKQAAHT